MLWLIWLGNVAKKEIPTPLKSCCSLQCIFTLTTPAVEVGRVWTSKPAEFAPRANEAGGEPRLWADILEM